MRRFSIPVAILAVLISVGVAYTLRVRLAKSQRVHIRPTPPIRPGLEGVAPIGWSYTKSDPELNRPIVRVEAASFESTHDPSTFELREVKLRLYHKEASSYTFVRSVKALFDEGTGLMKSEGPVYIVMNVPGDKNAEDPAEASKLVRVTTSGVVYETKSGKASTDQAASFVFPKGSGQAVGGDYDPNTKILHLKAKIALDWIGDGPAGNKMHIETADLIYKEAEQKVYLSPWSKMQRLSNNVEGGSSIVQLLDQRLHQVDTEHPAGVDQREDRKTEYSADAMTSIFDEDGQLVQMIGNGHARIVATQPAARTVLTGAKADLRFALASRQVGNEFVNESQLHLVMADGNGVAESTPLPRPGVKMPETRTLRSEHIELEMKPGGKDLQEIRTSTQAQLEFKPNRADQAHRIIDAGHLRVLYGEDSYVDSFLAWTVATHTEKPQATAKPVIGPDGKPCPPPPALTWSDTMTAKFKPASNEIAFIDQSGNFRYEEGARKASASKGTLEQAINRITLDDKARVLDDTGSASGDHIVMNQGNGDMDVTGHVLSTHEPDRKQKPGTSMLDETEPMQAQADAMQTREDNTKVFYEGHVVLWQGGNRISANNISIDRDLQLLTASGNVISELLDRKSSPANAAATPPPDASSNTNGTIYTVVHAPELVYRDDSRLAHYTGGVKLLHDKMTITSAELQSFLSPKTEGNTSSSSLDRAYANGDVKISDVISPGRTRVGTADHAEYFTKDNKVLLNGGAPQMVDSLKGITKGQQLTYFSDADHLIVDGKKEQPAFTRLKKK